MIWIPAAENLLRFLADQEVATTTVPDDRKIVIERMRDELGDWRVCVLTPFGSRVHAPWAMAITAGFGPVAGRMWRRCGRMTDSCCVFRKRCSSRLRTDPARPGRGDRAGAASAQRHSIVRREIPRECRAGAAPAAAARAGPDALVAAAQARLRSALRRLSLSFVSHPARGLS